MRTDRPDFTFALLEEEVAKYSPDIPLIDAAGKVRAFLLVGMVGALVGMTGIFFPSIPGRIWLVVVGGAAEVIGLVTSFVLQLKRDWKSLRQGKAVFAGAMDVDYARYRQLIEWLRGYPSTTLRDGLGYVRRRSETMRRKLGLLSGGVERLGILPLVVALFLQVRSFTWSGSVNYLELIAAAFLVILYGASWWSVLTGLRLDLYQSVLSDALGDEG